MSLIHDFVSFGSFRPSVAIRWVLVALPVILLGCPSNHPLDSRRSEFSKALVASDGSLVLLGHTGYDRTQVNLFVLGPNGDILKQELLPTLHSWRVGAATLAENDDIVVGGRQNTHPLTLPSLIRRVSIEGNVIWGSTTSTAPGAVRGIHQKAAGEFIAVEVTSEPGTRFSTLSSEGDILQESEDSNGNCGPTTVSEEGKLIGICYGHINSYSSDFELESSIPLDFEGYELAAPRSITDFISVRNGDFVFVGSVGGPGASTGFWIVRLSPAGEIVWLRNIDLSGDRATAVIEDEDDSLYVAGRDSVLKLNSEGQEIWRTTFSGEIADLVLSPDGFLFAAGRKGVEDDDGVGAIRMLLLKLDKDGNILSEQIFQGIMEE